MIKKVAVIGAGRWGRNIVKVLSEQSNLCEVVIIAHTGSAETAGLLAEQHPYIPTTTDIKSILTNPTITHVCIATPIATHYEIAHACIIAGKYTFVEKPLSSQVAEVEMLHQRAQEKNIQLATGYVYLFNNSILKLQDIIRNGTNVSLETKWYKWGTFDSPIQTNLLVHELAIAHFLMGKFEKIISKTIEENLLSLQAKYKNGEVSIIIDRKKKDKQKIVTAVVEGITYVLENGDLKTGGQLLYSCDTSQLLKHELISFLIGKQDYDWKIIDMEVAKILELLKNEKPTCSRPGYRASLT